MMLGEFGDPMSELFDDTVNLGLLRFPAYLFFYSFMCIVFLVMLNFLLAIIVDAFVDVKNIKEGNEKIRWDAHIQLRGVWHMIYHRGVAQHSTI